MDSEKLANLTREWIDLLARAQTVAQESQGEMMATASRGDFSVLDPKSIYQAYFRSIAALMQRPMAAAEYSSRVWFDWVGAWQNAWLGKHGAPRDKRFRDERWDADPVARGLRDAHLALEADTEKFLAELPEGSKDSLRVKFYTRQFLSALSPSNYLMLNPVARFHFLETEGESLLDGFRNLVEDLERGHGRLSISTTDPEAFEVGVNIATSTGKVIYQNDLMQLIQFDPLTETQKKRPMLMVPAWINRYYIMDLRADNSLVRYLLEQGHTVFLISWANPTEKHSKMSFEDYMKLGPLAALDVIEEHTGEKRVDILGFCIGGILVMATLALLAARKDKRIATATTFATLVDFTEVGDLGVFVDRERLDTMREYIAEKGYLEDYHLQNVFSMLRENDMVWSFHVMNYLMGRKPPAFDLLYWNADATRLPATMLLWYLEKIYIENGLRKPGHLSLDGTPIDITTIDTPLYVLATKEDHIAPWTSVYPINRLVKGEVHFVLGASGHIAGVINPPNEKKPKYGYWLNDARPTDPGDWLEGATYHEGSWWPEWSKWLDAHNGRAARVPARNPADGKLKPIEDAPGSYVRAK